MAHIVGDDFGICGYYGAVVMVGSVGVFHPFIVDAWIEDLLFASVHQFPDVAVNDLCGIAGGIRADIFHALLIDVLCGHGAQHHVIFQFRKECVPEGIILKDIQHSGNGDAASYSLFLRKWLIVLKESSELVLIEVGQIVVCQIQACALLTAISCDVSLFVAESGDGEETVVLASPAAAVPGFVGELFQFVRSQDTGYLSAVALFKGVQRAAIGSHDTCDIRTDDFASQHLLDGS